MHDGASRRGRGGFAEFAAILWNCKFRTDRAVLAAKSESTKVSVIAILMDPRTIVMQFDEYLAVRGLRLRAIVIDRALRDGLSS